MRRRVIYGPPGTGKTTKIIELYKEYIDSGVDPDDIGICSYTKSAANTVLKRALESTRAGQYVGTIHSFAFNLIELSASQVVNNSRLKEFNDETGYSLTNKTIQEDAYFNREDMFYYTMYNLAKTHLIFDYEDVYKRGLHEIFKNEGSEPGFLRFCEVYDKWKKKNFYYDFNDMLFNARYEKLPVKILFVDEAQDLSLLQWELIHSWIPSIEDVIICGDDDQAIYKFNGGYDKGMVEFQNRYRAEITVLSQSFRVPKIPYELATRLHDYMGVRTVKKYRPRLDRGEFKIFSNFIELPKDIFKGDVLILYRNNVFKKHIKSFLESIGVAYLIEGEKHAQQSKIKAIEQWIEFKKEVKNHKNKKCLVPKKATLEKHLKIIPQQYYKTNDFDKIADLDWWDVLELTDMELHTYRSNMKKNKVDITPTVRLSSIHSAKGDEADTVILYDALGAFTSDNFMRNLEVEAKIFYVAATRARNKLYVVSGMNGVFIDYFLGGGDVPNN